MHPHDCSPMPRRRFLAGLSAAPAAVAAATLPHVVMTHSGPVVTLGDDALIAQAALLVRLEKLHTAAHRRWRRREEAVDALMPGCPIKPVTTNPWVFIHHTIEPGSDLVEAFEGTCRKPLPEEVEATRRHAEVVAAREAEKARLSAAHGVDAAEALVDRLWGRLEDATADLEGMQAATPAGLAAKASAVLALDSFGGWAHALVRSLAADALALGGRTHA